MTRYLVKPAPDARVRDPATREPIPAAGIEIAAVDAYWARRRDDGDVTIEPAPKAQKPAERA